MKTIILIAIMLIIGWYGNLLYKQNSLSFFQSSVTVSDLKDQVKCITKDGEVIYGSVPQGTKCEQFKAIKGSQTIVPGTSYDDRAKNHLSSSFKCDGRQYCSQMISRAEAEFFIKNCPNTKMDGDYDGIPCENDSRF